MRESRNRGEVFFFDYTVDSHAIWCTNITESDELLTAHVENGGWFLKYDKKLNTKYVYDGFKFTHLINTKTNTILSHRVKVHWKQKKQPIYSQCHKEYEIVLGRAVSELVNPTPNEFLEPTCVSYGDMLEYIDSKSWIDCDYDYAQYQCKVKVNGIDTTLYARDADAFDYDAIPF
jgi:hypothetical protein